MTTSQLLVALLDILESCYKIAYDDGRGNYTIGWGHTKGVRSGMVITKEQAIQFLHEDCAPLLALVANLPPIAGAALASFGFNCGMQTLKRVLSGNIQVTAEGFLTPDGKYYGTTSKGLPMEGLMKRRKLEAALILAGGFQIT